MRFGRHAGVVEHARGTTSGRSPRSSCSTETLTPTDMSVEARAGASACSCRQASRSTHSPIAQDQAGFLGQRDERRRAGSRRARRSCQRSSASTPVMRPSASDMPRLVHQPELAAVERLAQRADDRGALARFGVHRLVVDLVGVAAVGLGLVHRGVGELQQVGRHLAVVGIQADADRRRDRDFVALVDVQRRRERSRGSRAPRCSAVVRRVDVLEHDGELVAAQARDGVGRADGLPAGAPPPPSAGGRRRRGRANR